MKSLNPVPAAVLAALCALVVLPATAQAGEVYSSDFDVEFLALPGEENQLTVTAVEGATDAVTYTDSAVPITIAEDLAGACSQPNPNTVVCEGEFFGWRADLGNEDDRLTAAGDLRGGVFGGSGDDELTGSDADVSEYLAGDAGTDTLIGRSGDDELYGSVGVDRVFGGPGEDHIGDRGGEGSDAYDGGPGSDVIAYNSQNVFPDPYDTFLVDLTAGRGGRTNNGPETDTLAGIEDVGTADLFIAGIPGSPDDGGNDVLIGDGQVNNLRSGGGNDQLNPLGGTDTAVAGHGDDNVNSSDGESDRVLCGQGNDTVVADQFDTLSSCENSTIQQRRAAGADVVAPDCRVRNVKRSYGRGAFFKGFTARLICDEAATLSVQLLTTVRSGQVGGSKVGDLVLAQRTARSAGGSAVTRIKVKPGRKFAKRLTRRKGLKVRLQVDATDQYGNRDRNVKRVKVAKPKKRKKGRR